jgi:hypothetical protein
MIVRPLPLLLTPLVQCLSGFNLQAGSTTARKASIATNTNVEAMGLILVEKLQRIGHVGVVASAAEISRIVSEKTGRKIQL